MLSLLWYAGTLRVLKKDNEKPQKAVLVNSLNQAVLRQWCCVWLLPNTFWFAQQTAHIADADSCVHVLEPHNMPNWMCL